MTELRRILVVEDDPQVARLACEIVEREGFAVDLATCVEELIEQYVEPLPALILLDLKLQNSDAIELIDYLAKQESSVPIALMSGLDKRILYSIERVAKRRGLTVAACIEKTDLVGRLPELLGTDFALLAPPSQEELRRAVHAHEFQPFYQPIVDARSEEVTGAEVLARWLHPTRGVIGPAEFLPLMENTTLLSDMTLALFDAACDDVRQFTRLPSPYHLAFNISGSQLHDHEFIEVLMQRLADLTELSVSIELELTETMAFEEADAVMALFSQLRLAGISLAIDDFGSGYSSLIRLLELPFNRLKVDQALVCQINTNAESRAIVKAVTEMGHSLGMEVLAEGVEDRETLEVARKLGIDHIQGFLFGRPMPAQEFANYLARPREACHEEH